MNLGFGVKSLILFVLSIAFLILITLFESLLTGLSGTTEKVISFLLLVLPGIIGIVFGVMGVVRSETKRWVAIIGILLNASFALFNVFVLSFAG